MRKYKFELEVEDDSNEYWKELKGPAVDRVQDDLADSLVGAGWTISAIRLKEFYYKNEE
jgi:hypothetical protein